MHSNGERLLKFTKETLPVSDTSTSDEPIYDIYICTGTKEETTKIRDEIIKNQEIVARLNHRVKYAHMQLRVERALIDKHSRNVTDLAVIKLTSDAMENVNSTLQELKIYSAILRKDVRNEV